VRQVRNRGCTVILTTHYMEEAERLCDRVLIMNEGRVVALDTPQALVEQLGAERRLVVTLAPDWPTPDLMRLPQVSRVDRSGERLTVFGGGPRFVSAVIGALEDAAVPLVDLRTEQPDLEDVFLALTGQEMRG